jgi:1,4-dihydroxy-2-naphthoate octaprenyltransferase
MKAWIKALRLRTLPLAVSGILVGNALAYFYGHYDALTFKLSLYTALLLQILSNLANDYGDFKKGTDNEQRIGPERAMQSGKIKEPEMKMALYVVGFFAFICGLWLVYHGTQNLNWQSGVIFIALGILALIAAITYTVGKNAYGYKGLGDLLVFIFFGCVAVGGSFYLQYKEVLAQVFLPAAAIGFFAAAVLNMNNMRDVENDKASGKITIPVRLGHIRAKGYHLFLTGAGMVCAASFIICHMPQEKWYALVPLLVFVINAIVVVKIKDHRSYDKQLKIVVLGTLLYALTFSASLIW